MPIVARNERKSKESMAIAVAKQKAQKLKEFLVANNLFAAELKPKQIRGRVIFPIKKEPSKSLLKKLKERFGIELTKEKFTLIKRSRSLKEALRKILTQKEVEHLVSSFDTVGNIAIIEIPAKLRKKAKIIARTLLELNKNIETVCMITGPHKGKYRIRPLKVIAGKKQFKTIHRESGCVFKVDVSKVFFSPRLSYERMRVAKQIKPKERVAVFFAGVGPFAIVAAKHSKLREVVAIELNPTAYNLMKENIKLNKLSSKVRAVKGDVKKIAPRYKNYFDRIVMPLPKHSKSFLREAFISAKKNAVIHYYREVDASCGFAAAIDEIKEEAKKYNKKIKVIFKRKVRTFSPKEIQVVIDFVVC
ncbi:MAG: class I SAM-dependent methyltransferase family protein [Candidatus Diapherotrites archaeon]|nr:class I SAM-dependent methyltransferase family protein [Candidatus Diapherotrites archaeon]